MIYDLRQWAVVIHKTMKIMPAYDNILKNNSRMC